MKRLSHATIAIGLWFATIACGNKLETHLEKFRQTNVEQKTDWGPAPDVFKLPESGEVADRIHDMSFAETVARLGAHRFRSHIRHRFESGENTVSLDEQATIVQAVNGDYRVQVENTDDQGFEAVSSGQRLFIRNRYGSFHPRERVESDQLRIRELAYGGWPAIFRLYRGQLAFRKQGMVKDNGRDGIRFAIQLSQDPPRLPGTRPGPEPPAGVQKYVYPRDPTPAERDGWRDKTRPVKASGELVVDADSGTILGVDFEGQIALTLPGDVQASLTINASCHRDQFGGPAAIAEPDPKTVSPIPERISPDTHPLDFYFGKGATAKIGPAAGVAGEKGEKKNKPSSDSGGTPSTP